MKKIFSLLVCVMSLMLTVATFSSCSSETDDFVGDEISATTDGVPYGYAQVQMTTDLNVGKSSMAKVSSRAGTSTITSIQDLDNLVVYDYIDSVLVDSVYQKGGTGGVTNFGEPVLNLKYGKHTLYIVAHKDATYKFDTKSYFITSSKTNDTFVGKVDINVTPSSKSVQCVLNRAIWKFGVTIQDAIPTNCAKFTYTVKRPKSFSLDTFKGSELESCSGQVNIPSSYVGVTGLSVTFCGYSPTLTDEFTTEVSFKFTDADGKVIQQHNLTDVPLQNNYQTKVEGNFFGNNNGVSITASGDWNETIKTVALK